MLFGTLSLNVLFYGIPRSNCFYLFVEQSHLTELTENYILDEPTRNKSLLREQCIQAERSEYTRFSMLEKGNASSYGRVFPFLLHGFRGMR